MSSWGNYPTPPSGPLSGGTEIESGPSNRGALTPVPQGHYFLCRERRGFEREPGDSKCEFADGRLCLHACCCRRYPVRFDAALLGWVSGFFPEAFSYGPTIVEVTPNAATADGGQTGAVFGYGFGSTISGVQVTVGGQNAPVVAIHPTPPLSPYPFPIEGLQFTIPPGSAGSTADVTVTTSAGSTTAKAAFRYTAPATSFPTEGSLQAGIYNAERGLYYFTDAAQIQVLSESRGWMAPFALPGTSISSRLMAISESPDKTKLAVSDFGGQAIYLLDPDTPASVQRFPMPLAYEYPAGLTITNGGIVYFVTAYVSGQNSPFAFHKLDTSTGAITDFGAIESMNVDDKYGRVLLSPDGSRVYCAIDGATFWLDTSNDQMHFASPVANNNTVPEAAISGDGSIVDVEDSLDDASLNQETEPAYVDWETWLPSAALGQKFSQDGSIFYQPLTDGIDLLPRNTGQLLYRVQIPGTMAAVYDSLVVGPGSDTVAVITTKGVSILDLSSLPIPAADTQPLFGDAAGRMESAGRSGVVRLRDRPRLKYGAGVVAYKVVR